MMMSISGTELQEVQAASGKKGSDSSRMGLGYAVAFWTHTAATFHRYGVSNK
jgi:hypothetical protein